MRDINYQNVGLAGVQTDAFTQIELFFGDTPAVVTEDAIVPESIASAGLPAWTPVHINHATRVISLVEGGDPDAEPPVPAVAPNAITVVEVAEGSPANVGLSVYTAGHFNIYALNWPESLDTEAKRRGAFAEQAGNQIRVSVPYYHNQQA